MEELVYQAARRDDYQRLAEWLVQMSQKPDQHCLHTWSGQSAEELHQELLSYWDESELCYVMALRSGQPAGAMGSEYDQELRRAWLHGPHVTAEDWEATAGQLFTRLLVELPVGMRQLDAYLNVENTRGRRFYLQRGFQEREHLSYDFQLIPDERVVSGHQGCLPLGKEQRTSFKQLYRALFPATYYSAERVMGMIGRSHQVLVVAEWEKVLGFAVVKAEKSQSEGEIQFIGVREDCRRKGYGRRLLLSAIDWLLDEARVSSIFLNVSDEKLHARSLYESVGFRLRFAGVGLQKTLVG